MEDGSNHRSSVCEEGIWDRQAPDDKQCVLLNDGFEIDWLDCISSVFVFEEIIFGVGVWTVCMYLPQMVYLR